MTTEQLEPSEALEGWMIDLEVRRRSDRTRERYRSVVLSFLRWTGKQDVRELDGDQLRKYILVLMKRHNSETLKREVGNIKTFGRWLSEQEFVERDPFRKVRRPSVDQREWRIVQPEDAQRILAVYDWAKPDEFRDYVVVCLTLDTGLRISEVCGAKLQDVDLMEGSLQVWGKGRKQRRVPLSPEVKLVLKEWIDGIRVRWATSSYLFVSRRGGPLDRHRVSGRFRAKVKQAGIPYRVRFHDLRHAAATYALRAGMPKERVSRMLGHANDAITSIYEHLEFRDIQEAHALANPLRLLQPKR